MKKVLLATLMVALMMATVFHVNAVSVQKETLLDEETTGKYKLNIVVFIHDIVPIIPPIFPCKVVVTHEDNPSFRIVEKKWGGYFSIKIPEEYKYPDVNVYHRGYEQKHTHYPSYNKLHIYIRWAGIPRTLNNPFINRLPILNQLLQLWVR